jgi:hypothetical protein
MARHDDRKLDAGVARTVIPVSGDGAVPPGGRMSAFARAVRERRDHVITAIIATAGAVAITAAAANEARGVTRLNDFYREAAPSYSALIHGHLLGFARLAPAYGGSLVLRAPFALLPTVWGGGVHAIYFASALPCMLALVAFCVWLAAQPRRRGAPWPARIVVLICCIGNPMVLIVLQGGHPEEVLGAVLCVGAVMLASSGRAEYAGILVGLAVANKPWALVAVPVVIATLSARRGRTLLLAAGSAGAVLLPLAAAHGHGVSPAAVGGDVGNIFNPPQLLWWFGHQSWIVREARPVIVLASLSLTLLWCGVRRRPALPTTSRAPDALILLALVLLLRAALDPWSNVWYHIPFVFALLAYEIRSRRAPLVTVACMTALLIVVPLRGVAMSTDLRAALYAAIVLPMICGLAARLYIPATIVERLKAGKRGTQPRLSTYLARVP